MLAYFLPDIPDKQLKVPYDIFYIGRVWNTIPRWSAMLGTQALHSFIKENLQVEIFNFAEKYLDIYVHLYISHEE